ncbi:MAG: TrmH family RNA methyltransferase [Anaerolineales bacterium]
MTIHITSPQNPRIKELIHLRESKRDRHASRKILVEGRDEIRLALAAGYSPLSLFLAPGLGASFQDLGLLPGPETFTVSEAVFAKVSYREHPDGYLGVFPLPQRSPDELNEKKLTFVLVIEGIEKPGNLGAILRSADAAGAEAVFICDPRLDPWNPNVIRASRGTIFSLPAYPLSNEEALSLLRRHNLCLYAATPEGNRLYTSLDLTRPLAWIVGSEDKGLSSFWKDACDAQVAIPMFGRINSLNVSVATAILLFETVRQRMEQTG